MYDEDEYNVSQFQEQDLRLLKAITTDNNLALNFVNTNEPSIFIGDSKQVGSLIFDHIKKYKTLPTKRILLDKAKSNDIKNKIENLFEILPSIEFDPIEYQYDLDKINQRYIDTTFSSLKDDIRFHENENLDQALDRMKKTISEIEKIKKPNRQSFTQKGLDEYLPEFHQAYVERIANPQLDQGIQTGYSYFDYLTKGVSGGDLVIIGGETGSGKSVFLNNFAIQMWMQKNTICTDPSEYQEGCHVLYFSLEMGYKQCFRRTLARLADVPIYGLRDSKLSKAETESLNLASKFIKKYCKKYKFEIVDIPRGVTINQIEERFLEARERLGLKNSKEKIVVVIDYLGLMEDDSEGDDWLKLGKLAGKVHEFMRYYDIPGFTAAQLTRVAKGKNSDPSEHIGVHRIGRSNLIMHNASIGLQIESRKDEHMRDTFTYHLIKNRDGDIGKHEIIKKFANSAIYDIPYIPAESSAYNDNPIGFDYDSEDISEQVKKILGI